MPQASCQPLVAPVQQCQPLAALAQQARKQQGTRVQLHGVRIQCHPAQRAALRIALQEERAKRKRWTPQQWADRASKVAAQGWGAWGAQKHGGQRPGSEPSEPRKLNNDLPSDGHALLALCDAGEHVSCDSLAVGKDDIADEISSVAAECGSRSREDAHAAPIDSGALPSTLPPLPLEKKLKK